MLLKHSTAATTEPPEKLINNREYQLKNQLIIVDNKKKLYNFGFLYLIILRIKQCSVK